MIGIDNKRVAAQLGLGSDKETQQAFTLICKAVDSLVSSWIPEPEHKKTEIILGCEMLVARLWRRRSSPSGVESLGELGTVYVARYDPDIAILLGLGSHARPMVG